MRLRKKQLRDYSLYVVLDRPAAKGRDFFYIVSEAIRGGADIVQLRDKEVEDSQLIELGKRLRELTNKFRVTFIVNDRADIALELDADGVHLGQQDLSIETARKLLGKNRIIGISTHSLEQAIEAERLGADYISVGPIFGTPTKPTYIPVGLDLIRATGEKIKIPFVAIGGIELTNLKDVLVAGARIVAVVRAVVSAEDVELSARRLKEEILSFKGTVSLNGVKSEIRI